MAFALLEPVQMVAQHQRRRVLDSGGKSIATSRDVYPTRMAIHFMVLGPWVKLQDSNMYQVLLVTSSCLLPSVRSLGIFSLQR